MDATPPVPARAGSGPSRRRIGTSAVVGIVNCALGGVMAAYLATRSVSVTLIAGAGPHRKTPAGMTTPRWTGAT